MHLMVIACEVLAREVYHCAAQSVHQVTVELHTQGLHDNSDVMRETLQQRIDAADSERYDAVLLGYGLCNNGTAGLVARDLPLVLPRGHDCITLLLGSKERYAEHFDERPGTYYYSSGWLEYPERRGEKPDYSDKSGFGGTFGQMREYEKLVEQYGEDNARYLSEFVAQWEQHYTTGALISFDFLDHLGLDEQTRRICREKGWEFLRLRGQLDLLQDWLDGKWDDERFLAVAPGERIEADHRGGIVRAAPADNDTETTDE